MKDICQAYDFSEDIAEELFSCGLKDAVDSSRIKEYVKTSFYPLLHLFGSKGMAEVDKLLRCFYQMDDEARRETVEMIRFKLQYHRDTERTKQISQIRPSRKRKLPTK